MTGHRSVDTVGVFSGRRRSGERGGSDDGFGKRGPSRELNSFRVRTMALA